MSDLLFIIKDFDCSISAKVLAFSLKVLHLYVHTQVQYYSGLAFICVI